MIHAARLDPAFFGGFTTRAGGVSEGPFASFNFGLKWGDDPAKVAENRARLVSEIGADALYTARQVHGIEVLVLAPPLPAPENVAVCPADGLCTNVPGVALGVLSADCVAILFADPKTGVCAAAHAGWRGVAGNLAGAVVAKLTGVYGTEPGDLQVALGPSIGPCCFEVGPDVAAQFAPEVVTSSGEKALVDLRAAISQQLERAGIKKAAISADPPCTRCNSHEFYSYRQACHEAGSPAAKTGLHMGVIMRVAASG